ncbi:MAG: hypothetical protein ABII89_07135 [Candidatus Omnitrophota bacterium]
MKRITEGLLISFFILSFSTTVFGQSSATEPKSGGARWKERFARQVERARAIPKIDALILGAGPFIDWERKAVESWNRTFKGKEVVNFAEIGELTQSLL